MSMIEDGRKVLQDFIAPELRAIDARLAAVEKRLEDFDRRLSSADKIEQDRFAAADKTEQDRFAAADKIEQDRFAMADKVAHERFERILAEIRQVHRLHELELRMARIEARERGESGINETAA